ncbi:hypothetical protein EON80_18040 [bacterium]|nr:MAG: hypothetical protein EON80_18040 [bacterium]
MFNPLNLEKDDANFVVATKDAHERELKIVKLTISRNWILVAFLLQSFLLLAALLIDPRQVESLSALQIAPYVLNAALFSHLDIQVKMLKASRSL